MEKNAIKKFEYNTQKILGLDYIFKRIPLKDIVIDNSDISPDKSPLNSRPLSESNVMRKNASYVGFDTPLVVALSSKDNKYHIVDGQHRLENKVRILKSKKKDTFKYGCQIVTDVHKRKLDPENAKDKKILSKISFSLNEGNISNHFLDKIRRVTVVGWNYYIKEKRKIGLYDYISKHIGTYEKIPQRTLEACWSMGNFLYNNDLWSIAISGDKSSNNKPWSAGRIREEMRYMKSTDNSKNTYLRIYAPKWVIDELKDERNNERFWISVATRKKETIEASKVIKEPKYSVPEVNLKYKDKRSTSN